MLLLRFDIGPRPLAQAGAAERLAQIFDADDVRRQVVVTFL